MTGESKENKRWEFWNTVMGIARDYLSLDKSTEEAKAHRISATELFKREKIIPKTETVLERFSELEDLNRVEITVEVMDNLKECINDYVSDKFVSTIVLGGLITERITDDLLKEKSRMSKKTSNMLNQNSKISILKDEDIITSDIAGKLHQIRRIRNRYIHPKSDNLNTEKDALLVLTKLIDAVYALYGKDKENINNKSLSKKCEK